MPHGCQLFPKNPYGLCKYLRRRAEGDVIEVSHQHHLGVEPSRATVAHQGADPRQSRPERRREPQRVPGRGKGVPLVPTAATAEGGHGAIRAPENVNRLLGVPGGPETAELRKGLLDRLAGYFPRHAAVTVDRVNFRPWPMGPLLRASPDNFGRDFGGRRGAHRQAPGWLEDPREFVAVLLAHR